MSVATLAGRISGALLAGLWLVLACGDAAGPDPPAETWVLEEELRIGSVSGPGTALTEVGDVAVHDNGLLFVEQPAEEIIRVFDDGGRPRAIIGGRGGGPAEFQALWHLGLHGDTLWATDLRAQRVTRFTLDGDPLGDFTIDPRSRSELGVVFPRALLRNGRLLLRRSPEADSTVASLVSFHPAERSVVEMARIRAESGDVNVQTSLGPRLTLAAPIAAGSLVSPVPDGRSLVIVHRDPALQAAVDSFRVLRIGQSGDTLLDRRVRYEPVPLPTALADSVRDFWVGEIAEFLPRSEAEDILQRHLRLPGFLPPAAEVMAAADGRIWLRREELVGPGAVWMVLDSMGRHESTLEIPAGVRLHAADRNHVWGSVTDSLDIPYLVRYRIVRSPDDARRLRPSSAASAGAI